MKRIARVAALIVVCASALIVTASQAVADIPSGTPPTITAVTSVDVNGRAYPQVSIDWGAYSEAPVGVLDDYASAFTSTPSNMQSVIDYSFVNDSPQSYRAIACYANCSYESILNGQATAVAGPRRPGRDTPRPSATAP